MKLISLEMKETSNGKPYKRFTLDNNKKLQVFNFDPRYDEMQIGVEITDADVDYDTKWDNYKLKSAKPVLGAPRASYGASRVDRVAAEEIRDQKVKENMDVKQIGIKVSGAMRDATETTLRALKDQPFPTDDEFKSEWLKWRDWYIKQFDYKVEEIKDPPPF